MQSATISRQNLATATVPTKKSRIVLYVEPEIKERLEQLAVSRNRSVSNLMETLAIREVQVAKEQGELKE